MDFGHNEVREQRTFRGGRKQSTLGVIINVHLLMADFNIFHHYIFRRTAEETV